MPFPDSRFKAPNVFFDIIDGTGSLGPARTISVNTPIVVNIIPPPPPPIPVADFIGKPLTGSEPLIVEFTDLSTNSPTSWEWDFENNGSTDSTLQNPTHIYYEAGTYSVKLTVYNNAGTSTVVKTAYIDVISPPIQPITIMPFLMDNSPGFEGELTLMPFRMGIGLEFENPDVTIMPFVVNNAPAFTNPNITIMPFIVNNGPAFTNPNITFMPFVMDNGPAFSNPNITLMPFVMDNSPGFENPNITTLPFLMDNSPGFKNPDITVMPFTMNRV